MKFLQKLKNKRALAFGVGGVLLAALVVAAIYPLLSGNGLEATTSSEPVVSVPVSSEAASSRPAVSVPDVPATVVTGVTPPAPPTSEPPAPEGPAASQAPAAPEAPDKTPANLPAEGNVSSELQTPDPPAKPQADVRPAPTGPKDGDTKQIDGVWYTYVGGINEWAEGLPGSSITIDDNEEFIKNYHCDICGGDYYHCHCKDGY